MVLVAVYALLAIAVGVAIVMSFFVRRHGEAVVPSEGWRRTDEVSVDPTTDRRMRVWIDPVDDSRHYVPET